MRVLNGLMRRLGLSHRADIETKPGEGVRPSPADETRVSGGVAMERLKRNRFSKWNTSPSTDRRSADPDDASNRIRNGYFTPALQPATFRIPQGARIFTMGSCFARELEWALQRRGFDICSMPAEALASPELQTADGTPASRFFHRYNVPSMEIEFRRAVGDLPFDEARDLLVPFGKEFYDLNYGRAFPKADLDLTVRRRRIAREMVAGFASADLVVVTLGLTEAWYHRPSRMYCNSMSGDVLARHRNEFEFCFLGFDECMASLERLYECVRRHHQTGEFQFMVTVSPVPLAQTFTSDDIVVANSRAKSTLRAVAGEFCDRHANAVYFPSYEIATLSDPACVWKADAIHVLPECVKHIIGTFSDHYIQPRTSSS